MTTRTYKEIEADWKAQMGVNAFQHALMLKRIKVLDKLIAECEQRNAELRASIKRSSDYESL